jgi:16S rRNA (cytidine1402-2'-O)-methyltransferase
MDAGAVVCWKERIRDGEVSALHTAENLLLETGDQFWAEYQNEPKKHGAGSVYMLTPEIVQSRAQPDRAPGIVERLRAGASVAVVSDAGTPMISDPGQRLAHAALAEGLPVTTEPGASAVLTALVLAGLPAERFFFEGFLPAKAGERRRRIQEISGIRATLVLFEAPHRVAETMADLASLLGNRAVALARELTKKFETVRRGTLPDLAVALAREGPPRGEIVLVIGPPEAEGPAGEDRIDAALHAALEKHSQRDAVEIVAGELGLKRREVYARALRLSEKD